MKDTYPSSASSPAKKAENVSASDTVDFPHTARAMRFDVGGIVSWVLPDDSVIVFTVIAGKDEVYNCKRINATGTAAGVIGGNILAIYG